MWRYTTARLPALSGAEAGGQHYEASWLKMLVSLGSLWGDLASRACGLRIEVQDTLCGQLSEVCKAPGGVPQ